MKLRICSGWFVVGVLTFIHVLLARAQDFYPTVTIYATDPQAAEPGTDTGTFTVRRTGGTNFSVVIFYVLSGTASNGVDYEHLGGTVLLPAGVTNVSFNVTPIDDAQIEGTETVIVRIVASPLDCATCGYDIGQPDTAQVSIEDDDGPRSGLYAITSGTFTACCGLAGDLGYRLPAPPQSFVRLDVDSRIQSATMTFLREDAQTVFTVQPCPPDPPNAFSFSHGLIFTDRIVFHVDPAQSYWNYDVPYTADTLMIDGVLGIMRASCADVPTRFGHSNVVARLIKPLRIQAMEGRTEAVRFQFTAEPPYDYFVEYTDSLAPRNWLSLTNFRAEIQTIQAVVTDPVNNSLSRFYRVRKQPCYCRNAN